MPDLVLGPWALHLWVFDEFKIGGLRIRVRVERISLSGSDGGHGFVL